MTMLNARNKYNRKRSRQMAAPLGRPGDRAGYAATEQVAAVPRAQFTGSVHPLTNSAENSKLYAYESSIKEAFDSIIPTLKQISALQHEIDFCQQAQRIAKA